MSAHSCNELCSLDKRFHEIQKYEGEYEFWNASKQEMKEFLWKKVGELTELMNKLS